MFIVKRKIAELLVECILKNEKMGVRKILNTIYVPEILQGGDYRPLHVAVKNGRADIIDMLIKAGANVNLLEALTGKTPIFFATNYEILKMLIDAGADVNAQDEHDHNTVIHESEMPFDCMRLILNSGFNLNITNRMGWNVLHMHTAYRNSANIELIIEAGVDVRRKNNNDKTAIDLAKIFEVDECISLLERYNISNELIANQKYQPDIELSL
ncbi:MAG: ankyrin repeat domain-containing protein [Methylococcales bacterium]